MTPLLMRLVRRLDLASLLVAFCASPALAGPVDLSLTDICVTMGAAFAGSDSRVVGYPACVGGVPTGLVGGVVALPIAGLAGGVASFWGSGGDAFEAVWKKGALAGFGLGAMLTGYPVYLAKAAFWDGPQNIRCFLTERCGAIRPDPGVDYEAKKKDVLRNLPFVVYRLNPQLGFAITDPALRGAVSGTHDAILESVIWQPRPEAAGLDQVPEPHDAWAEVYQMEDLGWVPAHCPWYYVSVEYGIQREFDASCAVAGNLSDGTPVYRSKSESYGLPTYFSVRLGKDLRRTLLVVKFDSDIGEQEISQLLPMLENLQIVSTLELISAPD